MSDELNTDFFMGNGGFLTRETNAIHIKVLIYHPSGN